MSDAQDLRGRTVIITGASSGISAATASALHAADAHPAPPAPASLPVRRKTTRQAAITRQEPRRRRARRRNSARPDIAYVPVRDAPPLEWGLIWPTDKNTVRVRAFPTTATT